MRTLPIQAIAFALALFSVAATAEARLVISPGNPRPSDTVTVTVDTRDGSDPCLLWGIIDRYGERIVLAGGPTLSPRCPDRVQSLEIGRLPAGRYTVVAGIEGLTEPYGEVHFDVREVAEQPAHELDVALSNPSPRAGEPLAISLSVTHLACAGVDFSAPPQVVGDRVVLDGDLGFCVFEAPPAIETAGFRHALPPLPAGDKTIEIRDRGTVVESFGFHVAAATTTLAALGGQIETSVRWIDRAGVAHDGVATRLSDTAGQFWFFDADNPEITVKLVDGSAVNFAYWVFVSSLTDLGFTVTVRSSFCVPGACVRERTYTQQPGHNRNFIDTGAFPNCANCSP